MSTTQPPEKPRPAAESRDSRPPKGRRTSKVPFLVAGVALVGLVAVMVRGGDGDSVRSDLAIVQRFRQDGQLERAAATIARLRTSWQGAEDDRLQRLDAEQAQLDAIEAEVQRLTAMVLDPTIERTHAEWIRELQAIEGAGAGNPSLAARRVRGSLTETLQKRPKVVLSPEQRAALAQATKAAEPTSSARSIPPAAIPATPAEPVAKTAAADPKPVADPSAAVLADAQRLAAQGLFGQAIAVLQESLAHADGDAAEATAALRREIETVRRDALRAMQELLAEADRTMAADRAVDAGALLANSRHRFPATTEFQPLVAAITKAEAAIAAKAAQSAPVVRPVVDEAVRMATLAQLRASMDAVRAAEERGAFVDAARQLREAAGMARERDPDFATRLENRAAEAELMAAWHQAVAAVLQTGRSLKVTSTAGRAVTLQAVQGAELVGTSVDGTVHLTWLDVSSLGISMLAEQTQARGEAALGAATLLYKNSDGQRAEALLAKVLQADAAMKPAIDGVVSRGRGEPVDARGYSFGKDGFVSARSVELQKEAQKLVARLETALGDRNPEAREKVLAEVMASGPDAHAVLVAALRKQFEQKLAKIEASGLKKQVDRLTEQRAVLDQARTAAKALIYDEEKYFYPYKPPAVSADKFAEYNRVQAEVNRLVDAVRDLWKDDRLQVRVPSSLRTDLDRIDWIAKVLGDLGSLDGAALARIDWARALPAGDSIGIREFCLSSAERIEIDEWRRTTAYNAIVGKQMPSSVRELLAITNEYRAMFRHRPLAVVKKVCEAAQGHAEEMTKLGYFAHMSPTPGRRTPYDRMRLVGYLSGVSENIALVDGALGAHNAWCTSSGHHRNLLDPGHREIGIGSDGRNWVQNFGAGNVHRDDPAWKAAAEPASR